ncbi:MAG: von Willebrand factor type A domain-containing protein [Bacteroidales bacterium]|nr:von Willebrand factor type A domain-containing protein [Bacteroidales bacterium]
MTKNLLPASILLVLTLLLTISFTIPVEYSAKCCSNALYGEFGNLEGTVTDQKTGDPIPSASLLLYQTSCLIASGHSDTDGTFLLSGIPTGSYLLEVTKPGYKQLKKKVILTSGNSTKQNITLQRVHQPEAQEDSVTEQKSYAMMMEMGGGKKDSRVSRMGGSIGLYPNDDCQSAVDFNTESYDLIRENGFKKVLDNPLSTFSIDVDRASYSNIRRFLNNHTLPYKDAIRIEEMVNYFDYDYPQPENGDPFSVTLEMGECFWNRNHQLVMIGIQGKAMKGSEIPPANLVFLVDVSGSMDEPNKLPLLKQSFKILVNNLRPVDKVAMVVYAGAAGCVLESTPGDHKEKIMMSLDNLKAGGSTAGGAGIRLAYQIARQNYISGGNNRVILATDGDFNIGASSDAEMTRLIEEKRNEGVFLSVLGFGMGNYKDSKMEQISNAGNGNYAYIDNILEAKKVFGEELWGTLFTIAKDVKIQVEFNPEKVKAYRLIGYENRMLKKEDFNNDRKDAGDIGSGHTVTALYEVIPSDSEESVPNVDPLEYQQADITGGKNLLTLKLRYKEPADTVSKLITHRVTATQITRKSLSENLKFASAVAAFGMVLRDSEFKGDAAFDNILPLALKSVGSDKFGYRREFVQMVETAGLLTR